jgi:hypothetical protein
LTVFWHRPLRDQQEITGLCFDHTSGIHTPMGNSEVLTRDFFSVRLPAQRVAYSGGVYELVKKWQDAVPLLLLSFICDIYTSAVNNSQSGYIALKWLGDE